MWGLAPPPCARQGEHSYRILIRDSCKDSHKDSCKEILPWKSIGRLIKPKSIKELYRAIADILKLDNDSFENQKKLARIRILNNFSQNKMLASYNKLYSEIVDK